MKQNNDFKPGNTRENDWIYDFATTRSYYGWDYNRQNQQGQNTECGSAVGKYQENVGKMGDMLIQYIQNVTVSNFLTVPRTRIISAAEGSEVPRRRIKERRTAEMLRVRAHRTRPQKL